MQTDIRQIDTTITYRFLRQSLSLQFELLPCSRRLISLLIRCNVGLLFLEIRSDWWRKVSKKVWCGLLYLPRMRRLFLTQVRVQATHNLITRYSEVYRPRPYQCQPIRLPPITSDIPTVIVSVSVKYLIDNLICTLDKSSMF